MAEIRSFERNSLRDEKMNNENRDFKSQIAKHRWLKFLRNLGIILIVAAIIIVCINQWKSRVYSIYEVVSSKDHAWISGTTELEFDGNILIYSKDGVSCTDQDGNVVWNQTYEMQNPIVSICKDKVAIGDYNGRTIYVCSTSKILGSISTNLPIRSLTVSADGIVAAILEDSDITWINVFTVDGKVPVTAKTQMKNSGYPLQIDFSPNSDLLAVSYLFIKDGKATTRIAFYNFGDVGQNYQDKLVSTFEYENVIVPELRFLTDASCVAVGDERIMFYKGEQIPSSPVETIQHEQIQKVLESNSYLGLIYNNDDLENRYRMDVYDSVGKQQMQIYYDFECSHLLVHNGWIIIYNEEECRMMDMKGTVKFETHFDKNVHLILPTSYHYKYVLLTGDSIDHIELK